MRKLTVDELVAVTLEARYSQLYFTSTYNITVGDLKHLPMNVELISGEKEFGEQSRFSGGDDFQTIVVTLRNDGEIRFVIRDYRCEAGGCRLINTDEVCLVL